MQNLKQVEGFVKAAQKVGRGLTAIFKKKTPSQAAGTPQFGLDDLLHYSNVRVRDPAGMSDPIQMTLPALPSKTPVTCCATCTFLSIFPDQQCCTCAGAHTHLPAQDEQ